MNTEHTYHIIVWRNENSRPETRRGLPYALAWAIATHAGWHKTQVVDHWGIICLETKHD
mgnify:FL=1